ncbi:MAG: polysaccharide deacetylase family protein [Paenibacillus macerans]|uniref:Glycosyl hydrolase 57 family protein n=1 Tax=Paenibacillus macerans TaxID=44252 RepID=A0A090YQ39_PAEMA|nr:polysaccharide deacetylase family protein [Paenibacillus macerans]KFM94240.1 glycosyl hydrolase 57 family protein [Paenibacillus macerans]MCY7561869.1 polysaccharide deacetylase family protein [Paenibacillus macerans]MDU7472405.1 polysaccharide deacetylase family protein [Paenibacillus macerans]MEC0138388.1 polysaccharide deacetylase family protein [Paenibacillus macerans]MEC0149606.1 polysaccharide deacetylase family protein [Paenibacillus macerans]
MSSHEVISRIAVREKAVAFTFDDGPNPEFTPQILDIFREAGAKATFFMIGTQMEKSLGTAQAVHEQGHEIGNHTYTHPAMPEVSPDECRRELAQTEELIVRVTGSKPRVFRPPYFATNAEVAAMAAGEFGYHSIGAVNGAATDWEMPGVRHIVDKTREALTPGSVLLFHDGFDDRSQTVEAVRILVSELTRKGYRLVTVSELLEMSEDAY